MRAFTLTIAALCFFGTASHGETIKIATWNIEHLRAANGVGAVKRDKEDFDALGALAAELDADVIALQEVDGPEAAARVFDPTAYDFFFSDRNHVQRTGFAVRKTIEVIADTDFTELALDGSVRRGTDITVRAGGQDIRMLSVHLKSRCFEGSLKRDNRHCRKLRQQLPVLESWIDARTVESIPFVVLGDFNRRFDAPGDEFFPELDDETPAPLDLVRPNEGLTSECRGGAFPVYIDHILLDEQAAAFLMPGSFEQLLTSEQDEEQFALSDHCAIAVSLNLNGSDGQLGLKGRVLEKIELLQEELLGLKALVEGLTQ